MELITGGDFKRMVAGAYSEFLLEYEAINQLDGAGELPGTHILRTLGSSIMPLADTKDDSIGGLSRRIATAAVFGARGNAGVVLSQLFQGIARGLQSKYEATSSEFGKAFQYGIIHAERVLSEIPQHHSFIDAAKLAAKNAHRAVRDELPIPEILLAALNAGKKIFSEANPEDAGAKIMFTFLSGCLKGLDGNFVSPAVSLSLGLGNHENMPDPRDDVVKPYCIMLRIKKSKANVDELEEQLQEFGNFALVTRKGSSVEVHIHTDHVGKIMEQAVGWGALRDIRIINMSESHALGVRDALMPVAALAVASDKDVAKKLQDAGAQILISGAKKSRPSVAELVSAAHSDLAASYVLVSSSQNDRLVFLQAKKLLGSRVELVLTNSDDEAIEALKKFSVTKSAEENARSMI